MKNQTSNTRSYVTPQASLTDENEFVAHWLFPNDRQSLIAGDWVTRKAARHTIKKMDPPAKAIGYVVQRRSGFDVYTYHFLP